MKGLGRLNRLQEPQSLAVGILAGGSLGEGGGGPFLNRQRPGLGPLLPFPNCWLMAAPPHQPLLHGPRSTLSLHGARGCGLTQDRWEDRDAGGASRLGGEKGWQGADQRKRRRRWLGVTGVTVATFILHTTPLLPQRPRCGQGYRAPECVAGERRASGDRQWSWSSESVGSDWVCSWGRPYCRVWEKGVTWGLSVLAAVPISASETEQDGAGEGILEQKALPFAKAGVPLSLVWGGVCLPKSHGRPQGERAYINTQIEMRGEGAAQGQVTHTFAGDERHRGSDEPSSSEAQPSFCPRPSSPCVSPHLLLQTVCCPLTDTPPQGLLSLLLSADQPQGGVPARASSPCQLVPSASLLKKKKI